MTAAEAKSIVAMLRAAFPNSKKSVGPDTAKVYESLLVDLDYEIASVAVRTVIGERKFFPAFAEIKAACREVTNGRRRRQESEEARELLAEPSDEEKQRLLAEMRAFVSSRWGTP